jgi:exodeoxyribonuclease-3
MTRFMAYNIYQGGTGRLPLVIQAIRDANPDVVGISEANGWGERQDARLDEVARATGLSPSGFAKAHTPFDLALLSRPAPRSIRSWNDGLWHAALEAVFEFPQIGEMGTLVVHLDPRDETNRLAELRAIVRRLNSYPNALLMGDLNSLSPDDPYDRDRLLADLRHRKITKFGTEALRFDCITFLQDAGFVDVWTAHGQPFAPTVPTPMNEDRHHEGAGMRLDYGFITPSLVPRLLDTSVFRTPATERASDHYPLMIDFDL